MRQIPSRQTVVGPSGLGADQCILRLDLSTSIPRIEGSLVTIDDAGGIHAAALVTTNTVEAAGGIETDSIDNRGVDPIAVGAELALGNENITFITGTCDGRRVSVDGAKLDLIEALADVTDNANVLGAIESLQTALSCLSFYDTNILAVDSYLRRGGGNFGTRNRYVLPYAGELNAVSIYYQITVDGGAGVDIDWELDIAGVNHPEATMTFTGGSGVAYYKDYVNGLSLSFAEGHTLNVMTNHLAAGNSVRVLGYDAWVRFKV